MTLDKTKLKSSMRAAFEASQKVVEDDPEADPLETLTMLLSDAIDAFVKSGDVVKVKTDVDPDPGTGKLVGAQSGVGKVQ